MIQVYYLASPEREHRFDRLFTALDAVVTFFPIETVPSLTAMVTRERAINQQNYMLCDLTSAGWSDEHILSAVQMLRRFSVVQPIFLAAAGDRTTALFKLLAEQRVDCLIDDADNIFDAVDAALRGDSGYAQRFAAIHRGVAGAAAKKVAPLHIPPGLTIDVAVCGAMARTGTTTQTFAIYHYLSQLGFRPVILDQGQAALQAIFDLYRNITVTHDSGAKEINGVRFAAERSEEFDAYITDYGVWTPEWIKPICGADISVLVGGAKPWELPALAGAYAAISEGGPHELVTLISFATPDDIEAVSKYVAGCASVSYHPDIWKAGSDSVYRSNLLPVLQRICGQG